jgi:hypothetical protein
MRLIEEVAFSGKPGMAEHAQRTAKTINAESSRPNNTPPATSRHIARTCALAEERAGMQTPAATVYTACQSGVKQYFAEIATSRYTHSQQFSNVSYSALATSTLYCKRKTLRDLIQSTVRYAVIRKNSPKLED